MEGGGESATTVNTTAEGREEESSSPDDILRLLDEVVRSPSKAQDARRRAYRRRLETFSPATYFAKPPSISPIVCARFGWKNVDRDVMVCDSCGGEWAVLFPPQLSAGATKRLTRLYERQLSAAHSEACPFRKEADRYLLGTRMDEGGDNDKTKRPTIFATIGCTADASPSPVPSAIASVLACDELELLEHPYPVPLVRTRWRELMKVLCSPKGSKGETLSFRIPDIEIDCSVLEFQPVTNADSSRGDAGQGESETRNTLLGRVVEILIDDDDSDNEKELWESNEAFRTVAERACALILLGWKYRDLTGDIQPGDVRDDAGENLLFECPICLAGFELDLQQQETSAAPDVAAADGGSGGDKPPPQKRLRHGATTKNPLSAHRYYCPCVGGFVGPTAEGTSGATCIPAATPFWQSLASRVLSPVKLHSAGTTQLP